MTENISFEKAYAQWLQGAVGNGAMRNQLRHADDPRYYAQYYPLLARWSGSSSEARKNAVHLVAAAIAQSGIKHDSEVSLGKALRKAGRKISEESAEARISAAYSQPLERAHKLLMPMLRIAANNNIKVDFENLIRSYLYWDLSPTASGSSRRRLLEAYYSTSSTSTETDQPKETNNNVH